MLLEYIICDLLQLILVDYRGSNTRYTSVYFKTDLCENLIQ